jgi:hypothetical protein
MVGLVALLGAWVMVYRIMTAVGDASPLETEIGTEASLRNLSVFVLNIGYTYYPRFSLMYKQSIKTFLCIKGAAVVWSDRIASLPLLESAT